MGLIRRRRGDGGLLQRDAQHLVDGHREVERHLVADLLEHVVEVTAVALGQDQSVSPAA